MKKSLQDLSEKYARLQETHSNIEGEKTIDRLGNENWYDANGLRHRLSGPAYVRPDGYQAWWVNGERHRVDGPAIIYGKDSPYYPREDWYIDGYMLPGAQVEAMKAALKDRLDILNKDNPGIEMDI